MSKSAVTAAVGRPVRQALADNTAERAYLTRRLAEVQPAFNPPQAGQ